MEVVTCKGFNEGGVKAKFKVMVWDKDKAVWSGNGLRFDTRYFAKRYATNLMVRQFGSTDYKILKTNSIPKTSPTSAEMIRRIQTNYRKIANE